MYLKDLTIKYCSSKAYNWQNSILTEPISFGKYSYLLHNAIIDDPKPYRQTVKSLVKNMYCWTISLARNKFKIEKFKHSEILSRTT